MKCLSNSGGSQYQRGSALVKILVIQVILGLGGGDREWE